MKNTIYVIMMVVMISASLYPQNINNTLGSGGSFTIKDGSTTFLNLSQSTGNLTLNNCLYIPSTSSSGVGVIYIGGNRFLHNYGSNNTFVGINSGNFTTSSAGLNTAVGGYSLSSLTTGNSNSAFGCDALYYNTTGSANSAFGYNALVAVTTGSDNSAFGYQALSSNTGDYNSAFGFNALTDNTTGFDNSAFGRLALSSNIGGADNSAFGYEALSSNTTGSENSAFGYSAGSNITTGSYNTCIGQGAQVPSATSNNQVRIGDGNVTYAGVQVSWTITSDKRLKSHIAGSQLGLDFISHLRPVSYIRKNDPKYKKEYGFIAQEVEAVLKQYGAKNAGMITIDDKGIYELRYNDLLAPMVKAIQDLKDQNDGLKKQMELMRASIARQVRDEVRKAVSKNEGTKVSINDTKN
ncbi:MAG: tail fiber domain-containing protein [Bacteroidota bacterium]